VSKVDKEKNGGDSIALRSSNERRKGGSQLAINPSSERRFGEKELDHPELVFIANVVGAEDLEEHRAIQTVEGLLKINLEDVSALAISFSN
jgi:hypothetical protein